MAHLSRLLLTATLSLPAAVALAAAPAPTPAEHFDAAAIAPDAHTIAWVSGSGESRSLQIATLPAATSPRTISPPGSHCANSDPVFSPDSHTLAFLSTCGAPASNPAQQQLFLYTTVTRKVTQLTHLVGNPQELAFSPDGRTLAFLFVPNATRIAGALDAMKPWSGVIGEDGIEIQRVAAVELSTQTQRFLTPPNLHAFEFTWSPDSAAIAFVGAHAPGENNWWIAQLYTQQVGLGPDSLAQAAKQACSTPPAGTGCNFAADVGAATSILDPATTPGPLHGLQIAVPRWSPDGHEIAFIGGLMSDQGATGGDLYTVPSTGGAPTNLTPGRNATPTWIDYIAPHTLLVSEDAQATTHLFRFNTQTRAEETDAPNTELREPAQLSAGGIAGALSVAANGDIAAIRSSFSNPPEIVAGQPAHLEQLTHVNDALRNTGPRVESVAWTSAGPSNQNFHVQGWLTYPAHFDPAKHYPLIVQVHGGPSSAISSRWGGADTTLADAGYFVLQPNPRGSFGQGEAFTAANVKDFGYGDLRDILAGLDTVEKLAPIDPHREGLTGWSYGGFMTMFAVTQTHRFRAAVAGAGISDWQSYYGENSIDQWMTPFFGASVYDDPAIYARSSAITFIKNVTTPTLIIVGDRDGECPAPQSFEFWHALRAENVKTQLVIYPAEGHRFSNPAHIADRTRRELAWFADNMPATPTTAQTTAAPKPQGN